MNSDTFRSCFRLPLRTALFAALVFIADHPLHAQDKTVPATAERAHFEVATIKPSEPDKFARTWGRQGRRFQARNMYLKYLVQWAWNLQANQVIGGPEWMDKDRFDIDGEIEGTDSPTDHEWKLAMQHLLEDRFQLKTHSETREMSAYLLTVAKGGPKLQPGNGDPNVQQMGFGGAVGQTMYGGGKNASISDFVGELQRIVLSRPVIDRTGLTGRYDIRIEFTREDQNATGMTELGPDAAPNLFEALEQQLGLKLERGKGPVKVLVIDSVSSPSEN